MAKFNDTNFDDSKLKRGSILYSSKISPVVEGEYALFNAYNMSWEGYKFGDSNEITYTGQVIAEIDKKATTTSLKNLEETVNSLQTRSADYYEQRWRTAYKEETVNAPEKTDLTVGVDDTTWHLTPQYKSGEHTWMTARKVVYVLNGSAYFKQYYDEPWSTPMKMTGDDGSVAYPVHQVLLYKWTDSRDVPTIDTTSSTKPDGWQESPGNAMPNTYLWMIQGQRQNSNYIEWDTDGNSETATEYWSSPICLSGADGKPGKDGTDVEFIYKRFTSEQSFINDDNNPLNWDADQNDDYCGPLGYTWNDNPEGVSSSYPYEYSSIRYKTDSIWGKFIQPFLWSKYGEDGVDGDGVEYIFYRSSDKNEVTFGQENLPPTFNLDSFQKSEVLGNNWTDDPQGVDENNVWEYVSVRKFKEITDLNLNDIPESFRGQVNVGDKIWFPYSEPALWSKYAFDAVASNLTIETDNDVMAVAIDGQNTTRNTSSNSAQVFLYHNLSLLSSDKYTVKFISHNLSNGYIPNESNSVKDENDNLVATITNTDNKWLVTINIPENVSLPSDGSFNFQIMATVSTDISIPEEIRGAERLYTFKVIGLSLSTIYQLKTDKIVVHRDIENKLENVNVTMFNISDINDTFTTNDSLPENFYIFAKPIYTPKSDKYEVHKYDDQKYGDKLFTKTNDSVTISQYESKDTTIMILTSVEFNLVYTSDAIDKQTIIDSFSSTNKGGTLINNGVLVDREIISVISDGANGNPGVDSKSQEYIYFLCDEFGKTFTGDENPATWISTKENYQTDDYPFIGTDGSNTLKNGWTDHPQGISETQRYEYISTRTYDTSTKTWGAFSEPVIWANWGHSGEDGDGVEYIYYLCDNEYVDVNKYPLFWSNDVNFDSSEYIKENSNWTDKPSGTSSVQKYEYVSVRKYKRIKNNNDILHLLFDEFLLSTLSNEYDNFLNNTYWDVQPGPNITLLDYIFNICENNYIGISSILSDTLENPQSYWYDKQTIGNDFNLYGFIYEALSKYFNYEERQSTYDQGSGTCTYFKLIENNDKFWTPYSEPTLWAKYGEKGADGNDGADGKDGVDGEKGAQGFTGPVVRMRGEFKERDTGGYYSDGSAQKNYDESTDGIRYKDIVWYNNQYWTPNPEKCNGRSADGVQAAYVTPHTGVIACYDSAYWPGGEASYWVAATQFDFVATKLLYADQALINQISTHDLIATNQNGYPVAGVTSGSKMYDKNNTEITSYLSTLGTVQYSENTDNDSTNVRIFAGEIWNGSSYSLTYAPFNVRQDGTAYMSKANIEGTVTASNLKLKENLSTNTQDQNGSFTYWDILNESTYVTILNDGEVGLYYILSIYGNRNNNIRIQTPSDNVFFKKSINGKSVLSNNDYDMIPPKNTLCQLVGINADNITYWNIIETPLAEQKIPDTILEHYDCTNDVILFAYNYEDYNNNGETINYFCTRPNDYDSFTPIRNVTFDGDKMTSSTDIWVEYTFLTYLESVSYKHTTNGAYANLGSLKYIKPDYKSPDSEGGSIDPGK